MKKLLFLAPVLLVILAVGCEKAETKPVVSQPAVVETVAENVNSAEKLVSLEQGFSLDYSSDWVVKENGYQAEDGILVDYTNMVLDNQTYPNCHFSIFVNHPGMGFEGENYKETEDYVVGGDETALVYTNNGQGSLIISTVWQHGDDQYIVMISFETQEMSEAQGEELFKELIDTWEFTE